MLLRKCLHYHHNLLTMEVEYNDCDITSARKWFYEVFLRESQLVVHILCLYMNYRILIAIQWSFVMDDL